jgi:ABC-2 type transport system permease protein
VIALGRVFVSQWVKLRRPVVFFGAVGTSVAFASLATFLILTHLSTTPGSIERHHIYIGTIEQAAGSVYGLGQSSGLLGLVAIIVCAFITASEYNYGTLRNLLVRQPRRLTLLGGSYLALMSMVVAAVVCAAAAVMIISYILAPGEGIHTHAWSFIQSLAVVGETALAVICYGTFGTALAVLFRSPVVAIGVAIGWSVAVENLLSAIIGGIDKWLPGELLAAIAAHGSSDISFGRALLVGGLYTLVIAVAAAATFVRRDVVT